MMITKKILLGTILSVAAGLGCSGQELEIGSDQLADGQLEICDDVVIESPRSVETTISSVLGRAGVLSPMEHIKNKRTIEEVAEILAFGRRAEVDANNSDIVRLFDESAPLDESDNYIFVDYGKSKIEEYVYKDYYGHSGIAWGLTSFNEDNVVDFLRVLPEKEVHRNMMDTNGDGNIDIFYNIYGAVPSECEPSTGVALHDTDYDGYFDLETIGNPYN